MVREKLYLRFDAIALTLYRKKSPTARASAVVNNDTRAMDHRHYPFLEVGDFSVKGASAKASNNTFLPNHNHR